MTHMQRRILGLIKYLYSKLLALIIFKHYNSLRIKPYNVISQVKVPVEILEEGSILYIHGSKPVLDISTYRRFQLK